MSNWWKVQLVTYLWGIELPAWWALLKENRFRVHPRYWPRAGLVTAASIFQTLAGMRERRRFGREIAESELVDPPVFILGHWGSGTTLLHSLLTRDQRFTYPTLFDVTNPHAMLTAERLLRSLFERFTPPKRVWDNVAVSLDMPAEDEFATCLLSGCSPYMAWSFPRREDFYDRFLTFDETTEQELRAWKAAIVYFLKKLTYKHGRRLVLKSPPHTARIRLLLALFPQAKFVHIHRHPLDVFQATRRLYEQALPYFYLQRADPARIEAGIIQRYATMYRAFFEQRALIPEGQFYEVGFDSLRRDPEGQIESLYAALDLPAFDHARADLRLYLQSIADYRRNANQPLTPQLREEISRAVRRNFEEWGYPAS